jgi:restriction system protein
LAELSWREFEEMLAAAFRQEGYSVKVTGDSSADGGVDLLLRRDAEVTLVQAKHWRKDVGVATVRELFGVMAAEKAARGIVVTSGYFSADAMAFAADLPIELIDGDRLLQRIGSSRATSSKETSPEQNRSCPACRAPMIIRTARKGTHPGAQFWGCSRFPGCRATLPVNV